MASIRKRGKNYLVVVSRGYDSNGKRAKPAQKTFQTPDGLTRKQEEKWIAEQAVLYEYEVKNGFRELPKDVTLQQYFDHFCEDILPTKLAYTSGNRLKHDMARILPLLGKYKLRDLTKPMIRRAYEDMKKLPNLKKGGTLSERTLSGMHSNLCSVLSSAVEEGYIDNNPAWNCWHWGAKQTRVRKAANPEMAKELIKAFEKENILYETYFKIILATGMRRGECCGLRWSDINYEDECITVQRNVVSLRGGGVLVKAPKTKVSYRNIYVSAQLLVLIKEYRSWVEKNRWPKDARAMTDDDYMFTRHDDITIPMLPEAFTKKFNRMLKKNRLPKDLSIHSLRHTNASIQIAQNVDVRTVASNLGHSSASTTLDIYSHAFNSYKKAAQAKISAVLPL